MIHVVRLDHGTDNPKQERLSRILKGSLPGREFKRIKSVSDFLLLAMTGEIETILFAVSIPRNGFAPEWQDLISSLMDRPDLLLGKKAAVIVDGEGELFTKDIGRKLIFAANYAGCSFPGKPLIEATGDLHNFNTVASVKGVDNLTAYQEVVSDLLDRLESFKLAQETINSSESREFDTESSGGVKKKKILAIHSSNKETSNTLMLLDMVKNQLCQGENSSCVEYNEISIRNGDIVDCRGCEFDACKHFGEKGECFYGGVMVEQVYPAILKCDTLILACPNYNDSVGANMMAMFNRLTALFYNNSFSEKKIYALIVSGYSGGDLLAEQIISALNCNKGFILPSHFAMIETANDPGSIALVDGIQERAKTFADEIIRW